MIRQVGERGVRLRCYLDLRRRRTGLPQANGALAVSSVALSGDGRCATTGHGHGAIRVGEFELGLLAATRQAHRGAVTSLALDHDGRTARSASVGVAGTARSVPGM